VRSQEVNRIIPKGFQGEVLFMEPMKNHTSLKIGGPADIFAVPRDITSLADLQGILKKSGTPFFLIGGGTNVLVKDGGIEGCVISLRSFRRIGVLHRNEQNVSLIVEAGTPLQRLVHYATENGYSGIEGLAGIPGSLGGAICGNAGAFGYEMKDVLGSLEIMDGAGSVERINAEGMQFGYRRSGTPPDTVILNAEIKLVTRTKEGVSAKTEQFLSEKRIQQPIWEPSAGCVFKNPPGAAAGKMIDEAGCKGSRAGDVEVSAVHANFFINKGNANASDFLRLMEEVSGKVNEKFGVTLEPEIKIVGRSSGNG
jgi:UDP-N-acetylmuramate dehydrogenase